VTGPWSAAGKEVIRVAVALAREAGGVLDSFATALRSRGLSGKSVDSYLGQVRRFAAWYEQTCGPFDPAAVSQLDVAEYRRWMQGRGCRPATVNLALVAFGRFFAWALEEGICSFNPAAAVKRVPEQVPGPRWLDRRAVGALMRAVMRYGAVRDRVLIMLLLHTGLRVSEACGLQVDDVEVREPSGWVRVRHGKGGKYREVPLNVTIRKVLKQYLGFHHPGSGWLFLNRYGGRLNERSAERLVRRYARLAGLDRVTVHTLRHTFCKQLIDAGESLDRVAALAGHASLNTTAR
jgi:integrase/recombinase XerC